MAEVQVNLPVNLQLRACDERLTTDELATCSLFAGMKKLPPLRKNPGSVVLRRFGRGDVVCEQGEAGATAFYILTLDDMYRILKGR